jgi:hypothetical protein
MHDHASPDDSDIEDSEDLAHEGLVASTGESDRRRFRVSSLKARSSLEAQYSATHAFQYTQAHLAFSIHMSKPRAEVYNPHEGRTDGRSGGGAGRCRGETGLTKMQTKKGG